MSTDPADHATLLRWIRSRAHPLAALDPRAPLADLQPLREMVAGATIVGLGGSTRGAHELSAIKHRMLRFLVEELGFRVLALEEDATNAVALDDYIRTGSGDPRALLADAAPFSRTEEMLGLVRWIRSYDERQAADPLRIVGLDFDAVGALAYDAVTDFVRRTASARLEELEAHYAGLRPRGRMAEHVERYRDRSDQQPLLDRARLAYALVESLPPGAGQAPALRHARAIVDFHEYHARDDALSFAEARMAENLTWWHEHTAAKLVYWGGSAHTANGRARIVSSPGSAAQQRNAGSHLRERFGAGYLSVGLTFDHGSVPYPVPPPAPEFADAILGRAGLASYVLDLRDERAPRAVADWLDAPARTRLIGSDYDPDDDRAHHMSGGTLGEWFDVIVHCQTATPIRPLA